MELKDCKVGMKVYFGRKSGEMTLGEITKVNPAKCKVKQLEGRGTMKSYPIGTIWGVPANLLTPADPIPKVEMSDHRAMAIRTDDRSDWFRLTQPPTKVCQFKVGDTVSFEARGQTITGKIKSINTKTVSVDGGFGTWRVPPSLLRASPEVTATRASKRSNKDILSDIADVYGQLSPENLHCDGEISRSAAAAKGRKLNTKLQTLFQEFGRRVSESEAYSPVY